MRSSEAAVEAAMMLEKWFLPKCSSSLSHSLKGGLRLFAMGSRLRYKVRQSVCVKLPTSVYKTDKVFCIRVKGLTDLTSRV